MCEVLMAPHSCMSTRRRRRTVNSSANASCATATASGAQAMQNASRSAPPAAAARAALDTKSRYAAMSPPNTPAGSLRSRRRSLATICKDEARESSLAQAKRYRQEEATPHVWP